ncbi:MAG: hypothetical protein JWP65_3777 [Ramlibacter sp.]|jgi:hypothetical protein|uniref:hypothetical protein n=1 Tax=Ramlibacter sp. TaxID=1917967 RepID=UPI002607A459|nr:hypothetical protein [Ramlibacter sp.]MDB5753356.1 hypothetical protein [Ramlibacter sp.]
MDIIFITAVAVAFAWVLRAREQRQRIGLLAGYLSRYQIEKHMETLTDGYLRALGEADPQRREQIFQLLRSTEQDLCGQVARLAADFERGEKEPARVSKLPIHLPFATRLHAATFDMRQALAVHAAGIRAAVTDQDALPASERAFTVSAELFLLQHTCHWFCKSRFIASARMLARHKTSYEQVVAAVLPGTRSAYSALVRA